jgi:hypothetical protein
MNWDLILTVLGLAITVVLVSPFYLVIGLAYNKAKMRQDLELLKEHRSTFTNDTELDWAKMWDGEIK